MSQVISRRTTYWSDVRRIHRLEYPFPVAYACHALWGACYAVTAPGQLLAVPVILALLAAVLPIDAQNPINAALDMAGDMAHVGKSSIGHAVRRLGPRHAVWWAGVEFTVAVLLAAAVSVWLDRPIVVAAVLAAVVLHLLYNVEPVRLKRRGWAAHVYFGLTFATLPILATFGAVRADFPAWLWPIAVGIGVLLAARTLWWALPDRDADASVGDRTVVVRQGVRPALLMACLITVAGIALTGWGVWWRCGPAWSVLVMACTSLFLVQKLRMWFTVTDSRLPNERRMRTHTLTLVVVADVVIVLVPVLAARW